MSTKRINVTTIIPPSALFIGYVAENGVTNVEFDVSVWVEMYGSGTATLIMKRWGDVNPYPIALEVDNEGLATWTISATDTAKTGFAYAQLRYEAGTKVKKSPIYTLKIGESIGSPAEAPDQYEDWIDALTHIAAQAMAEVLDIEGIVTDKTLTVDGGIADAKATGEALAEKVDAADYNELNARVGANTIALAEKADRSTTYTKTEVDALIESVDVETDTTLSVSGKPADAKTVGDAISAINESLSAVTGLIPVTYANAYIALNAQTADINSPIASTTGYMAYVVPCVEGDIFEVSAVGGETPRAYAFIDSNSNVLLVARANASVANLILTAPANSAYLIINDKSGAKQFSGETNASKIETLNESSEAASLIAGLREVYIGLESGIYGSGNGKKADYNSVRTKHMLDRATVRYIKVDPSWRVSLYFYANPEIYQSTSSDAGYISNVSLTSYSGAVIDVEQVISDNNISGAVAYTVGFFKYANGAIDTSTAMTEADITACYKNAFYAVSEDVSGIAFLLNKGIFAEAGVQYYGEPRPSTLLKSSGYINIDPSKHNALRITMPTFTNNASYGIAFYDKTDAVIGGKQIYGGQRNVYTKIIRIPKNTKYFRTSYWMDTTTYGNFKCELINKNFSETVIVAASNSSDADKVRADYVCTGINDELVLQSAINDSDHVYLCDGDYYIDSFSYEYPSGHFNAVCIGKPLATSSNISYKQANVHIYGSNGSIRKAGTTIDFYGGANIHVSDDCYEALDANTQYSIFGGVTKNGVRIYPAASLKIENVSIFLPDNQKKIICIDGWNLARLSVNNIVCQAIHSGAGGSSGTGAITPADLHIPVDGCIGVRGTQGSNYGRGNIWKSCVCRGFYEGFAVSGEHVIGIDLGTRFCNYGYTFNRWTMEVAAQYAHPITMINCYSELDFNFPYFSSQWHINAAAGTYSRQTINIIDLNMEVLPEYLALGGDYAQESTPGTVFGEISYTAITGYSTTPNSVSAQFWESGHGHNVKTRNMAHAQSGTTTERNSYTPTYMQTYFDTTLNKLLIYDGTAWVDSNGNVVN